MPRKLLKKLFPNLDSMRNNQSLEMFGRAGRDPNLWHLNRRSVSRAAAVGLFCAFVPIPGQMILAAAVAIILRANIPISVILVWVSNPLTMPALFYTAYKFGAMLLDVQLQPFHFEFSLNWLFTELQDRWQPFLVGCLCSGALVGAIGYGVIQIYWRWYVSRVWANRKGYKRAKNINR
jgi:uncharacterized protein (DUF2062 family)